MVLPTIKHNGAWWTAAAFYRMSIIKGGTQEPTHLAKRLAISLVLDALVTNDPNFTFIINY
jgi:hypothetical protein